MEKLTELERLNEMLGSFPNLAEEVRELKSRREQFAKDFATQIVDGVLSGIEQPKSSVSTSEVIDKFLASKKAAGLAEASIESYRNTLKPFARAHPFLPYELEQLEAYYGNSGKNSTPWDRFIVIRLLYNWAEERELLPFPNPFKKLKPPQKITNPPQHLSLSQLRALYRACIDDRQRALVVCLFGMGLRLKATRHIMVRDIGEDILMALVKKGTKTKQPVILHSPFRQVLLKQAEGKKDFIFPGRDGKPLSDSTVQLIIKRLFKRAGIEGVRASPHTGRHTRGMLQSLLGADTYSGRRLLGHSSTEMTDIYSEYNLEELRQKDRQVNPLLRILDTELGKKPDYTQCQPDVVVVPPAE